MVRRKLVPSDSVLLPAAKDLPQGLIAGPYPEPFFGGGVFRNHSDNVYLCQARSQDFEVGGGLIWGEWTFGVIFVHQHGAPGPFCTETRSLF